MSAPRMSAFLPNDNLRAFSTLAEASICLQCASPLNTQCGFTNCALNTLADGKWHIDFFHCECEACHRATCDTGGNSSAAVRDTLLDRHRFSRLDAALGVDEPLFEWRANAVPVLCIRGAIVFSPSGTPLRRFLDELEDRDVIFCSFDKTVRFCATEAGHQLFDSRVASRLAEIQSRFQISAPECILLESKKYLYARALFLRVVVAYDAMSILRTDLAFRDTSCDRDAQLLTLALQLFADTHLDLQVFCDAFGDWSDETLERPTYQNFVKTEWGASLFASDSAEARRIVSQLQMSDCVLLPPLERYYPHPLRAVYSGELLDLGSTLVLSNIWSQVDSEMRTKATSFAQVFLRKSVDHKCVAEGTLIGFADGTSRRVEELLDDTVRMALGDVACANSETRLIHAPCASAVYSGEKECVRVMLEDGRALDLTPDHRLMLDSGEWVEAKDLIVGTSRLAVSSIDYALDEVKAEEADFVLRAGEYELSMHNAEERTKTLSFFRLLGAVTTDGWISDTKDRASATASQLIDRQQMLCDAAHFGGAQESEGERTWSVTFRASLANAFRSLEGVQTGKHHASDFPLPEILFLETTPICVVREFLGGVFGGDGCTVTKQNNAMTHVYILHTCGEEKVAQMLLHMEGLVKLLHRCGVDVTGCKTKVLPVHYSETSYKPKSGAIRKQVRLFLGNSLSFSERVGFRYCNQKQMRLSAACTWWRRCHVALAQRASVYERAIQLHTERCAQKRKRGTSWSSLIEESKMEFESQNFAVMPKSLASSLMSESLVRAAISAARSGESPIRGADKWQQLDEQGCGSWFEPGYISSRGDSDLPTMKIKVIGITPIGKRRVYDLSVPGPESFVANGVVVHNCMVRSFHKMMSACLAQQPVLLAFLLNLLEVSSLGNYETARVQPMWRARLSVRRSFHWDRFDLDTWCSACHPMMRTPCPHCEAAHGTARGPSHKKHVCDTCAYLERNHRFLFFSVKEFYVYSIKMHGLLDSMLEVESNWRTHCQLLRNAIDDARFLLSKGYDFSEPLSVSRLQSTQMQIDRQLALQHDANKPTMRRLNKWFSFSEHLLSVFETIHAASVTSTKWTGYQRPQDLLTAPTTLAQKSGEVPPRDKWPSFFVCDVPLEHLQGQRWCDVYTLAHIEQLARYCEMVHHDLQAPLLALVGVSPGTIQKLVRMHYASELRNMPDNRIGVICRELFEENRVDFHITHYFLVCMSASAAVKEIRLDAQSTVLQASALRVRNRIDPWNPLPPGVDCLYFCRVHRRVFADISPPIDFDREEEEMRSRGGSAIPLDSTATIHGVCGAYYDHKLGGVVCSRTIRSASQSYLEKLGLKCAAWIEDDPDRVKQIIEARESERVCTGKLLESRSLLGRALKIGRSVYTLCVKCGAVCEWNDEHMSNYGMTCGREVRIAERERYTDLAQFVTKHAQAVVADGVIPLTEDLLLPDPPLNERGDMFESVPTPVIDKAREEAVISDINIGVRHGYNNNGKTKRLAKASELLMIGNGVTTDSAVEARKRNQPGVFKNRTTNRRMAVSELHRQIPTGESYSQHEWEALSEEEMVYRWTPEGRTFWRNYQALQTHSDVLVGEDLTRQLLWKKDADMAQMRADGFFEQHALQSAAADACIASTLRYMRRVHVSHMSDAQIVSIRDMMIEAGYMERRVEIVCAYCHARCARSSHFRRVTVNNPYDTLVDGHLGKPLGEYGFVYIWLCVKCFDSCDSLLKNKPVPCVYELFAHRNAQRDRKVEKAMRFANQ